MPQRPNHNGAFGLPSVGKGVASVRSFADGIVPYFPERNLRISGITRDSIGNALGSCAVILYNVTTFTFYVSGVSEPDGGFVVPIDKTLSQTQTDTWQVFAYKPGSPDVVGSTVNTLTGS